MERKTVFRQGNFISNGEKTSQNKNSSLDNGYQDMIDTFSGVNRVHQGFQIGQINQQSNFLTSLNNSQIDPVVKTIHFNKKRPESYNFGIDMLKRQLSRSPELSFEGGQAESKAETPKGIQAQAPHQANGQILNFKQKDVTLRDTACQKFDENQNEPPIEYRRKTLEIKRTSDEMAYEDEHGDLVLDGLHNTVKVDLIGTDISRNQQIQLSRSQSNKSKKDKHKYMSPPRMRKSLKIKARGSDSKLVSVKVGRNAVGTAAQVNIVTKYKSGSSDMRRSFQYSPNKQNQLRKNVVGGLVYSNVKKSHTAKRKTENRKPINKYARDNDEDENFFVESSSLKKSDKSQEKEVNDEQFEVTYEDQQRNLTVMDYEKDCPIGPTDNSIISISKRQFGKTAHKKDTRDEFRQQLQIDRMKSDMSALGTEFDKLQLQNADFDLGSAQFDMPQMNYRDPRDRNESKDREGYQTGMVTSSKAVYNQPNQNDADQGIQTKPILLKKAGDKKVISNVKMKYDGNTFASKKMEGLFDLATPKNLTIGKNSQDEQKIGEMNSYSYVVQALTRYITQKHTDNVSVKQLLAQRQLKEHVFEIIFHEFAKGQRLRSYDSYRREREEHLKHGCTKGLQNHEKKQVLTKKQQQERDLQELAQKMEQMEAQERQLAEKKKQFQSKYLDYEQKNVREKQKKAQIQYMRKAVATDEMTIDQANALIIKREKQDNNVMVKETQKNKTTQEFNNFYKQIKKLSEEIEQDFLKLLKEDQDELEVNKQAQENAQFVKTTSGSRSPDATGRTNLKLKQSIKKSKIEYFIKCKTRPMSAQNLTIYTQLHRQRRLQSKLMDESQRFLAIKNSQSRSPSKLNVSDRKVQDVLKSEIKVQTVGLGQDENNQHSADARNEKASIDKNAITGGLGELTIASTSLPMTRDHSMNQLRQQKNIHYASFTNVTNLVQKSHQPSDFSQVQYLASEGGDLNQSSFKLLPKTSGQYFNNPDNFESQNFEIDQDGVKIRPITAMNQKQLMQLPQHPYFRPSTGNPQTSQNQQARSMNVTPQRSQNNRNKYSSKTHLILKTNSVASHKMTRVQSGLYKNSSTATTTMNHQSSSSKRLMIGLSSYNAYKHIALVHKDNPRSCMAATSPLLYASSSLAPRQDLFNQDSIGGAYRKSQGQGWNGMEVPMDESGEWTGQAQKRWSRYKNDDQAYMKIDSYENTPILAVNDTGDITRNYRFQAACENLKRSIAEKERIQNKLRGSIERDYQNLELTDFGERKASDEDESNQKYDSNQQHKSIGQLPENIYSNLTKPVNSLNQNPINIVTTLTPIKSAQNKTTEEDQKAVFIGIRKSLETTDASIAVKQSTNSYNIHRDKLNKLSNIVGRPRSTQDHKKFYVNRHKSNKLNFNGSVTMSEKFKKGSTPNHKRLIKQLSVISGLIRNKDLRQNSSTVSKNMYYAMNNSLHGLQSTDGAGLGPGTDIISALSTQGAQNKTQGESIITLNVQPERQGTLQSQALSAFSRDGVIGQATIQMNQNQSLKKQRQFVQNSFQNSNLRTRYEKQAKQTQAVMRRIPTK